MVFNLQMDNGVVVTTCRAIDEDTMAVCTVDVNGSQAPHVMYGNMFRIKPEVYRALMEDVYAPDALDAEDEAPDSEWVGGSVGGQAEGGGEARMSEGTRDDVGEQDGSD